MMLDNKNEQKWPLAEKEVLKKEANIIIDEKNLLHILDKLKIN